MAVVLPEERLDRIRAQLASTGRVAAADLAREFSTSEDTIRRDLRDLAAAGFCRRVYGGALKASPASGPLRERLAQQVDVKTALARAATELIRADQVLFLDTGSTNQALAACLPHDRSLTVITNAPAVATALAQDGGFNVVMLGGRIDPATGGSFGPRAIQDLQNCHIDLCFLGTCAVSAQHGLSVFDPEEAAFKRMLVAQSRMRVVMATSDKLSTTAPFGFAPLGVVDFLVLETGAVLDGHEAHPALRVIRAATPAKAVA